MTLQLQVAETLTSLIFTVMTCISLMAGRPLNQIFRPDICHIYFYTNLGYGSFLAMGGFAMALYRLMIVKFPTLSHSVIGMKNLMYIILGLQVILIGVCVQFYYIGVRMTGNTTSMEFCLGQSSTMAEMLWIHSGGSEASAKTGIVYRNIALHLGTSGFVIQVTIYILLMRDLYHHDKAAVQKGVIHKNEATARNKTNVITLSGMTKKVSYFVNRCIINIIFFNRASNYLLHGSLLDLLCYYNHKIGTYIGS